MLNKTTKLTLPVHCVTGAGETHAFCNDQAVEILRNDGYGKEAAIFSRFKYQLEEGVKWADKGLKSFYHFYNAESGIGKWKWPNAILACELYINRAIKLWKKRRHESAMFYLGAASHLVQDMCVPHHACCVLTDGHNEYELWVEVNRKLYAVYDKGIYTVAKTPGEWVKSNARFSVGFYIYVKADSTEEEYDYSTRLLLPRAQRSTSGFWLWFISCL